MTKKLAILPDIHQNFWQLTSIQVMTYGLPSVLIGVQIAKEAGLGAACISILVGNLVLWLIGISMVFMSSDGRNNAIQNIGNYFGVVGAILANIILGVVFLMWYPINLGFTVSALNSIIPNHSSMFNYLGIALGVLTAAMASGGIVLIRKVCVVAFVFVLCLFFCSFFLFEHDFAFNGFSFSLSGIASVVIVSLSGLINLPTFFRHSRSRADSVFSLTLITVFISLFQFFGMVSGFFSKFNGVSSLFDCNLYCVLFASVYVLITSICVNLGNVYFASAVLEFFFPNARKFIGYILIGLCGSLFYALFGFSDLFIFAENVVEGFIVNLSVVLLMAYICKIVMHYKPRMIEKLADNICWLLGCIASFYVAYHPLLEYYESFSAGVVTSVLCFVFFVFVGKTVEAIKNL